MNIVLSSFFFIVLSHFPPKFAQLTPSCLLLFGNKRDRLETQHNGVKSCLSIFVRKSDLTVF